MSDELNEIKYLDFEIIVEQVEGDDYVVRSESGKNKAQIRFTNPFNEDKRKTIRKTLTAAALRLAAVQRNVKMRSSSAPEVREMKNFGSVLFQEAINGSVRELYEKCLAQAHKEQRGIRLRLTLDPSVDDLPWEFLCEQDDFLALNPHSPIVRYVEGAAPCSQVKVDYPLQVLVVIAKPSDEVPLDTRAEKESITRALKPLTDQGVVNLTFIEGPDTWWRMRKAMLANRTHILHFIGHGTFDEKNGEGVLLMEDPEGKKMLVDSERLRVLVMGKTRLALIVLNSCLGTQGDDAQPFSSVAAGLVKSGIPAVIAMQFEISDDAARVIAETFYTSLTWNMPVDAALTEARREIFLKDKTSLEWATPILYMQVPDGQLFEFKTKRPPSIPPSDSRINPLEQNAARRYREGEDAMARGKWAEAIKGFKAAQSYVPNYLDVAEKLAICEARFRSASLYLQAQQSCSIKNYDEAIRMLSEASRVDPNFADTLNVSQYAECGQKYQEAIRQFNAGNKARAAELLREVISCRPDFEDASERLGNLDSAESLIPAAPSAPREGIITKSKRWADFGKGWLKENFGSSAPPPAQATREGTTPALILDKTLQWRLYSFPETKPQPLVEGVNEYFEANGYTTQVINRDEVWLVQGKKTQGVGSYVGLGEPATVIIEVTRNKNLKVSIGCAKWLDKGGAVVAAAFIPYLLITNYFGRKAQDELMVALWHIVEEFVAANGGKSVE